VPPSDSLDLLIYSPTSSGTTATETGNFHGQRIGLPGKEPEPRATAGRAQQGDAQQGREGRGQAQPAVSRATPQGVMYQQSHYATLGIERRFFSQELLKKQYRALALRWHPDRNRGEEAAAAERFKEVQEAFTTLSDPAARAQYDVELMLRRPSLPKTTRYAEPATASARPKDAHMPDSRSAPPPPPCQPTPPRMQPPAWEPSEAASVPQAPLRDPYTFARRPGRSCAHDGEEGVPAAVSHPHKRIPPSATAPSSSEAAPTQSAAHHAQGACDTTQVEEWPGLAAALAVSAHEAKEVEQREVQLAVADVAAAQQREAEEIEEALQLVELAIKRVRAVCTGASSSPLPSAVNPLLCA
jgi:hypothetical protein